MISVICVLLLLVVESLQKMQNLIMQQKMAKPE